MFWDMPLFLSGDPEPRVKQVSTSLRFDIASQAYMNRTLVAGTSATTYTISMWIKRGSISASAIYGLFGTTPTSNQVTNFSINGDAIDFYWTNTSGTIIARRLSTFNTGGSGPNGRYVRDNGAWYHFMIAVNTTLATAADRIKVYVNGDRVTTFATTVDPAQNSTSLMNTANNHLLGRIVSSNGATISHGDWYMAEVNFIDGKELTPISFGKEDEHSGQWIPLIYDGTYGINGFYLDFSDNSNTTSSTLGKDRSGNSNDFTPNNFSVAAGPGNDSVYDVPSNYTDGTKERGNYPTFNPNDARQTATLSNGSLAVSMAGATFGSAFTTMMVQSGKWYWEVTSGGSNDLVLGVIQPNTAYVSTAIGTDVNGWGFGQTNPTSIIHNNVVTAYGGVNIVANDIIMCAVDADNGTIYFGKNGTWLAGSDPSTLTSPAMTGLPTLRGMIMGLSSRNGLTHNANFGQQPFTYTVPSGFTSFCSYNISEPTVMPKDSFQTMKYTGAAVAQSIPANFKANYLYIKPYNNIVSQMFDDVRGGSLSLPGNATAAEAAISGVTIDPHGFSLPANGTNVSATGVLYHSMLLKVGQEYGFDIVTYSGNGATSQTINHNLGAQIEMALVRRRNAGTNWYLWHKDMASATTFTQMDLANAETATNTPWSASAAWTSTSFVVGNNATNNLNASGGTYIAYCFRSVPGFTYIGSITNNGNANGTYSHCGFAPKVVWSKANFASGDVGSLIDGAFDRNPIDPLALLLGNSTEGNVPLNFGYDFLSGGFKCKFGYSRPQRFLAFTDHPQKYLQAK